MIAGTDVHSTSRRVLPWMGGPSRSSSPGRIRKSRTANRTTVVTRTNTGTEQMISTSQNVSIFLACSDPCVGNQSMTSPRAMPSTDAMRPTITICVMVRRPPRPPRGSTSARVLSSPIARRSYAPGVTARNGDARRMTSRPLSEGLRRGAGSRRGDALGPHEPAAGAEIGRCDPVVAAERLGELGGLAVADAVGHVADGEAPDPQQLGGAVHAHGGQVLTEGGLADLAVGALQLASRGGHATGDVVERQVGGVLVLDDGDRVLEEAGPQADGGWSVHGVEGVTWRVRDGIIPGVGSGDARC